MQVEPLKGVVPAHSHVSISITFEPLSLATQHLELEVSSRGQGHVVSLSWKHCLLTADSVSIGHCSEHHIQVTCRVDKEACTTRLPVSVNICTPCLLPSSLGLSPFYAAPFPPPAGIRLIVLLGALLHASALQPPLGSTPCIYFSSL